MDRLDINNYKEETRYVVLELEDSDIDWLCDIETKEPAIWQPGEKTTRAEWKNIIETYELTWKLYDKAEDWTFGFCCSCFVGKDIWIRKFYTASNLRSTSREEGKPLYRDAFESHDHRPIPMIKNIADKRGGRVFCAVSANNEIAHSALIGFNGFDKEPIRVKNFYADGTDLSLITYNYQNNS